MDKGGEKKISRRTMFQLTAAAAASTILPDVGEAASVVKAEAAPAFKEFLAEVENAGAGILQESRTLMGPSFSKSFDLILRHKVDAPWNVLKGTRLDPVRLEEKTVMLAIVRGQTGLKISRMRSLADMRIIAEVNQDRAAYAQGVPVASNLVLTNKHVSSGLTALGGDVLSAREHKIYDLAFALVPKANFSFEEMLKFPIPLSNEDVHAGFVVFTGINPNWTSHDTGASVTGRKTHGGLAIRVPPSWIPLLSGKKSPTADDVKRYSNSFIVEIPNAESLGPNNEIVPPEQAPFRGSSSSPVFIARGGEYNFCGVVDSVVQVETKSQGIRTFALFHGPEAINEAAKDLSQY